VIAPARTGKDKTNKKAVTITDQTKSATRSVAIPRLFILLIVTIKLIAPAIEDTPAKCNEKILKSTAAPEWA
jgi:hypothetical protein